MLKWLWNIECSEDKIQWSSFPLLVTKYATQYLENIYGDYYSETYFITAVDNKWPFLEVARMKLFFSPLAG